ncbi:hypothetical protein HOY82DRAFT_595173 [Tuber indicum]|nr:hypothetical protein HOY82DRAFT_595173 [Tuber indicum]
MSPEQEPDQERFLQQWSQTSVTAPPDHTKLNEIVRAVINFDYSLREKYILIGGVSLACQGSTRITKDVDILLPCPVVMGFGFALVESPEVTRRGGVIYSKAGESEYPVDILPEVMQQKTFEDIEPFTVTILDGVKTLDFPIALGIKIQC